MKFRPKTLNAGRWHEFSLVSQMANIGSEIERAISWKNKGDTSYSRLAFNRAIGLIDLTMADSKNHGRLFEIARIKEALLDYFLGDNTYCFSDQAWQDYLYNFAYCRAIKKLAVK